MTVQNDPKSVLLDEVENLLKDTQKIESAHLSEVERLLDDTEIKKSVDKIEHIHKEYGLTGEKHFNFFTSISDLYKWENFHSDVLKTILDPQTQDIRNIKYLNCFVELIKKLLELEKEKKVIAEDMFFDSDTIVEREKVTIDGRIDIFIHDDKKCIIVENKINNAPDMPNQLARYMKMAEKDWGFQIVAVVYIPPVGSSSNSAESLVYNLVDKYTKDYKDYIPKIKEKLVLLPVFLPSSGDDKGEVLDITHGFLDKIEKITEDRTAKVYIQQYSKLLEGMEEDAMSNEFKLDVLGKLLETPESRKTATEIWEVWNTWHILLFEACKKKLVEKGFADKVCNGFFGKRVIQNRGICVFCSSIQLGFGDTGKNMSDAVQGELKKILTQDKFSKLHPDGVISDKGLVYFYFDPNTLSGSLTDMVDGIVGCCEFLENEVKAKPEKFWTDEG